MSEPRELPDGPFILETGLYRVTCPLCQGQHTASCIATDATDWYRGRVPTLNAVCDKPECRKYLTNG